ncbi:peptidoglycan-binding domain-containing protein [Cochleicola gelatinilyticus]|uniref:Peptidoglycan binding-like domain-containing protein n=1 Tax=Cochleicola gelatinilyticus TaxID=1763537 RepID=A0A167J3V7_9FLAO|nr:peptidoglycan-binding domain-containing protein [Cochleicola gelatinilyticus]OAB80301.1 hypothetical protein ULVI_06075 [Cochleicola gelatinilyticus]
MKQIIIFLLVVILGILGYNMYSKYHRFHPPNYEYEIPEAITMGEEMSPQVLNYYEAVEALNGYVITQWGAERIDVRNPSDDDAQTVAAVSEYRKKLAAVKMYEAQLLQPKKEIVQEKVLSEAEQKKILLRNMFSENPTSYSLRLGERGAFVYEIQKLLIEKGYEIPLDGLFRNVTFESLKNFEEKQGLFPDGRLDAITFNRLLE